MTIPIPHNIQYPLHYDPNDYPVFDQLSSGTVSLINTITNCSAPVYVGDLVKITDPASPNYPSGYTTVQTIILPNSFTFFPYFTVDLVQRDLEIIHPTGEASLMTVLNRTFFTDFGPIIKRSLLISSGSDLIIKSATIVNIPSATFDQTFVGQTITISGTPNNRNDGTFNIAKVINLKTLVLEGSYFDTTDIVATTALLITLVNELKLKYNLHLVSTGVHGTNDTTNTETVIDATDLPSAITLLNNLTSKFAAHILLVSGAPPVHKNSDLLDTLYSPTVVYNPSFPNIALTGAIILVNELRKNFEAHRQNLDFHLISDTSDRILNPRLKAIIGSGPLIGPFTWSINNPELGEIADSPSDVTVTVNGIPTIPDAVFGLLGAIVLPVVINPGDSIVVNYSYIKNPAVKTSTANSFEYVLNQTGRNGESGICIMSSWIPGRAGSSTGLVSSSLSPNNIYNFIVQITSAGIGQLISSGTVSVQISLDGTTFGPPTLVPINGIFPLAPTSPYLPVYVNTGISLFFSIGSTTFDFGDMFTASSIGHIYPYRTYTVDPTDLITEIESPYEPFTSGWKYKGFERAYSAVSNDPATLISNVPTNKIIFDVLNEQVSESTLKFDPITLPQNATDPWILKGQGTFTLIPGGSGLKISDTSVLAGPESLPPFFSHHVDLRFLSTISAAFRTYVDPTSIIPDGVFTGVSFGVSDGKNSIIVGFIQTDATNLSSAISLANQIVTKFDAHLILTGTHRPNDTLDTIDVVNATDLPSLIILVNREKALFNTHIAYGDGNIHVAADLTNIIITPDAVDLNSAITLINIVQTLFDAHRTQSGVHYVDDTKNATILVRQIGILTTGYPDIQTSWVSYAIDWSQYITYRLVRNFDGSADLYLSGLTAPIVSVDALSLPLTANIDARIDPMQQIFFGTIGKQSVSDSYWAFIRVDIIPLDSDQVSGNKSISYLPNHTPEMDPTAPWINIGQSGYTKAVFPLLTSDSTASADPSVVDGLGLTTGAYKGYLRIEPILSNKTLSSVEFQTQIAYWTFGVDNRAAGVFIDDGNLSVYLSFLQASPTPATIIGINSEPFSIVNHDIISFSVDDGEVISYEFTGVIITLAAVITDINIVVGFSFASASSVYPHNLQFTSPTIGASSKITLIGGTALTKLGFVPGTYFGKDSNPEPRISWFGENFPDQDVLQWSVIGSQSVELLNRTLRILDSSIDDFASYSFSDPLHTNPVFQIGKDWKLDAKLQVISYTPGDPVTTGSNLKFCGALINVDEGVNGKTVELQLAVNGSNVQYVNILSYNPFTGNLDSISELPFNWADNAIHTYNIYTSKNSNLVLVLVDNILLGSFAYSSLNQGIGNPSINFGSGSQTNNPVTNFDLTTALSVVDWNSVCVFKDSKLTDPTAASNRYVGLYAGGDPTILDSYYTYQIDWSLLHVYRVIRDPSNMVSVFIDGSSVPVISTNYDVLRLPPSNSSFLTEIVSDDKCVAFGSFNPFEISRSIWKYVNYSIGKMTLTDLAIPPHNVFNQVNTISSSEHLDTTVQHSHFATSIWSGGTPSDDFLYDPNIPAVTILGEGTPPVPMTQDLDSRGGPIYTQIPVISISSDTYVDEEALPAEQFVVQVSIPDGVLYEAMKFFNFNEGETGHMSPFIDEATGILHDTTIGTVTYLTINSGTQFRRFPQYSSATPPPTGTLIPW